MTVVRWGAATYLEDQDHWHHAGIHRSVALRCTPKLHIEDVHAIADWDPATGNGQLDVRVAVGGPATPAAKVRVRLGDETVGEGGTAWADPDDEFGLAYSFESQGARVTAHVANPAPWSAEHPNLHDLHLDLLVGEEVIDSVGLRIGFRRVEVVGCELLVNGRAGLIKGVNRHDHDPRKGKAVSRQSIRHDIELMKAHNFNAVRTSHYPSDSYLYEVCDELGMYVIDEANVETHAYLRSLTKVAEWGPAILERITRMAQRDKNHPSIIAWSLGNESGPAPIFSAVAAWLREFDPTRPVQYESGYLQGVFDGLSFPQAWVLDRADSDVIPPMYPGFEDLEIWATSDRAPQRPLIMCEYAHAMNNSCGDLDRYWDTIRGHRGLQGGFIWDWVDQALVQSLPDGGERYAYGGDLGDQPNDGAFCLNGLVAADRTPHPSLAEAKAVMAPVRFDWGAGGTVHVANEHDFTDLAAVADLEWAVTIDGQTIASGSLGRVAAAPGETVTVQMPLPELNLSGWQIAHATIRCGDLAASQAEVGRCGDRQAIDLGADLPGRPSLWRAPIDNERFGPNHRERWRCMGLPEAAENIALSTQTAGALVTHEVTIPQDWDDLARVGVWIELPPEVVAVDWLGHGPHECYTDRQASALFGRWHTNLDDWPTPYVHPQASGNRTGVRCLRFLNAEGDTVLIIDELEDLDVTVSRWTDEELDEATHLEDLPLRDHGFVWIDARHRGVGSAAVGPDVGPAHRIGPGTYRWSYRAYRPQP